jgi:hypothetical protein
MKQWMIIAAVAALLIGSYMWNRNKATQDNGETIPPVEEIITQEDGTVVKKTGELIEEISEEEAAVKKFEIEDKVKDVEAIALQVSENGQGSGFSASTFEGDTYYQKITATNLKPLEKGYYYEAWLEKEDGAKISIGRLEMISLNEGRLLYQAKEDRTNYQVLVSHEAEDGDASIGEVVLRQ